MGMLISNSLVGGDRPSLGISFLGLGLIENFSIPKGLTNIKQRKSEKIYNFYALVLSTHILYHPLVFADLSIHFHPVKFLLTSHLPYSPFTHPRGSARKMPQAQPRPPMQGVASWELTKATALEAPKNVWITPWGAGDLWVTIIVIWLYFARVIGVVVVVLVVRVVPVHRALVVNVVC